MLAELFLCEFSLPVLNCNLLIWLMIGSMFDQTGMLAISYLIHLSRMVTLQNCVHGVDPSDLLAVDVIPFDLIPHLQDSLPVAVQSVRDELQAERESRKLLEKLHQKLAAGMSDTQRSLLNAIKELETERKSRTLLEDLCDKFAVRIRDYEHELHALKTKYGEEWTGDQPSMILHIAESWLDERMQMKMEEARTGFAENTSVIERLKSELDETRRRKPQDPSRRQVKFEEQMSRASKNQFLHLHETECNSGSCSNSGWMSRASPVQPWMEKLSSPGVHIGRSSSKLHPSSRENAKFKEKEYIQ